MTAATTPARPRVVHARAARNLTLSEVDPDSRSARLAELRAAVHTESPHRPHDITEGAGTRSALVDAIAGHLSPRAANPYLGHEVRAAYVRDAIEKAERCPLCAPALAEAGR